MLLKHYPVAIIGAGPVGMAAAAHLAVRNIPFQLFESGDSPGYNLLDWGHVRLFSPWRYNIDKAADQLLAEMNWEKPGEDQLPTGADLVKQYLLPLSFHPKIEPFLHFSTKVTAITRKGVDKVKTSGRDKTPFMIRTEEKGLIRHFEASAIIDASGTWQNPNPLGAGGLLAKGEQENSRHISYRIPDIPGKEAKRFAGKNVLVIGGGHSAINSLLNLAELKKQYPGTRLNWALRTDNLDSVYGGKQDDALEARGNLGIEIENLVNTGMLTILTPFYIHEISKQENNTLNVSGYVKGALTALKAIDEIIVNTGARPDLSIYREVRVQADAALECVPALADLIDPNIHSCGTVRPHGEYELRQPEPNFYVVGVKSYGRAPTFLMATGYEQVRSIAAWLDGDEEDARRVALDLPETGVCSAVSGPGTACCSVATEPTADKKEVSACCTPGALNSIQSNQINSNIMETMIPVDNGKEANLAGCCGGAPVANNDACCKLDEEKKAEGASGCGCNATPPSISNTKAAASCC